ncbi:MAG: TrkH family potassium uptake protein [Desulfitobacterium hafniense]|nr:TrkH family potassium uptake protein [Desulfitobacterium hafniense]
MKTDNVLTPARVLVLGFALVILTGAILLTLPVATVNGQGLSFLEAVFTATSATCVTGLVVVDTGTTFTLFGQLVVLSLIQIGGLGFMTFATLFVILLGRKVSLKERLLLQEALNQGSIQGVVRLAKYVVQISFAIEALGALLLSLRWASDLGWKKAIYYGIFHSVSAFNNAGFDLFGEFRSITGYVGDVTVNLVIASLIIIGGIGFTVISDVYSHKARWSQLSLHSRVVILTSGILILVGTIVIYLLEFTNTLTLGSMNSGTRVLASFFQAVTPRTAGYNTLNLTDLRDTTLLFIILLMFIGASPVSTGGGIKTTSLVSVFLSVISTFRGNEHVTFGERTIPRDVIQKSIALIFFAIVLVFTVTSILTITEDADLLTLLFETTSAFGTVGLSLGFTPNLSTIGRVAIIMTMFFGRVGPLTIAFAIAQKSKAKQVKIKYPDEKLIIG